MGRQRTQFDVSLKTLIDHGVLKAGPKSLLLEARNKVRKGDLRNDGSIVFEGKVFQSASSFAVAALRSAGAKTRMTANGWQLVHSNGRSLEAYRAEYISSAYGVPPPVFQLKGQSGGTATHSSAPTSPPDAAAAPPIVNDSNLPKNPGTSERTKISADSGSPANNGASYDSMDSRKEKGGAEKGGMGVVLSPLVLAAEKKKSSSEEVAWTESTDTCSDEATTDLIGNSRKRAAPRPELQMWLKKALKKRHVESQALMQRKSGDVC